MSHPTQFRGGKLPAQPARPHLKFSAVLAEAQERARVAAPPVSCLFADPAITWDMLGNDQVGDCITPETRVLTEALEWVPAGGLLPGDRLLGFDEDSRRTESGHLRGRWFAPAVVERADIVTRPCYELTFSDGTVVRSSAGHRWLTRSTVQGELGCQRWERTEDLRVGPVRQTRVVKPLETWETDRSWDAGFLSAAFDGEGHLEQVRRANRVAFNQTGNPMLDQVELSLKELGFEYHHETHNRNKLLRADGSSRKEMHTLRIGNRRDFLRFMGSIRPPRLLAKYQVDSLGRIPGDTVALVGKTFIGEQPVVMLDTSSRTYFAEGLASHNCTCAEVGHQVNQLTWYGSGVEVKPTTAQVLAFYSVITGYDPAKPSSDTGAYIQDVLAYWRKSGLIGHKIVAYAAVDVSNVTEVKQALALFGSLNVGINFPDSAMDQFNAGQDWDVVKGAKVEGGHCVMVLGYDANGLDLITWGQRIRMTWAFWHKYVDEAWLLLDQDGVQRAGSYFTGLASFYALGQVFTTLTGDPNPVPEPAPQPTPQPTPTPPGPSAEDKALAAAIHARRPVEDAWLKARSL